MERHRTVHDLLDSGIGLVECARLLGWALNTVKRFVCAPQADHLVGPPQHRPCLVDAYRDYLRERRAAGPVATTTLLDEIRAMGYTGSANLLVRYLN